MLSKETKENIEIELNKAGFNREREREQEREVNPSIILFHQHEHTIFYSLCYIRRIDKCFVILTDA